MAEPQPVAPAIPGADPVAAAASTPQVTPAPWTLTGRGFVLLLRSRARVQGRGLLGRFSAVGFVDYATSDVGPYRELLHVPHLTRRSGGVGPTVRDIWVTLEASAVSGNANWGLTKSVAQIDRVTSAAGVESWTASDEAGELGRVLHHPSGPALPIAKPAGLGRLLQVRDGQAYATPVGVRGLVRWTEVVEASFDPRVVDLEAHTIVGGVAITRGSMGFGVPAITPAH